MFRQQAAQIRDRLNNDDWAVRNVQRSEKLLTAAALIDVSGMLADLMSISEPAAQRLVQRGWETGMLRIDEDAVFDASDPRIRQEVEDVLKTLEEVPANTGIVIADIIERGQADPEKSVDDIADEIVQSVQLMGDTARERRSRAETIAGTAATTAFEKGQDTAWEQSDVVEGSSWLSQRDGRVTPGHFAADGQRVAQGDTFSVARTEEMTPEPMRYPGDPRGSVQNTINCRCTRRPLLDLESE